VLNERAASVKDAAFLHVCAFWGYTTRDAGQVKTLFISIKAYNEESKTILKKRWIIP